MLNFQGAVYIKNGFCLKIIPLGGSILNVNPGSVLIINQQHSSVITTEIYAKANPEIKRKYLESAASNIDISVNKFSEKEKETLLEWLKHNI